MKKFKHNILGHPNEMFLIPSPNCATFIQNYSKQTKSFQFTAIPPFVLSQMLCTNLELAKFMIVLQCFPTPFELITTLSKMERRYHQGFLK